MFSTISWVSLGLVLVGIVMHWVVLPSPRLAKRKSAADIKRLVGILRDGGYQGYVALEYEAAEDPWVAVPKWIEQLKAAVA